MHDYLDEHQVYAVEALIELKRICNKHDIQYYLLAGTTLGAVRHEGMIPWDDDIDVGFLLEDFKKLQAVIKDELDSRFEYVSPETECGFPRLFGKILYNRRSCVDLFLIAKWTQHRVKGQIHWNITRFCVESYYRSIGYSKPKAAALKETQSQMALGKKTPKHYFVSFFKAIKEPQRLKSYTKNALRILIKKARNILYKCCFFLKTEDYIRLARWNEDYFGRKGFDCYANIYSIYGMRKETFQKEWIENISHVTFEGETFPTVGDIHAYLTHLYGDYMQLPPVEKRVRSRHGEVFAKPKQQQ